MNDTVAKKSELVVDALQYAHDHNLDINNIEDVKKILEAVDPNHMVNPGEFVELLKTSDTFLAMKAKQNEDKKADLPN